MGTLWWLLIQKLINESPQVRRVSGQPMFPNTSESADVISSVCVITPAIIPIPGINRRCIQQWSTACGNRSSTLKYMRHVCVSPQHSRCDLGENHCSLGAIIISIITRLDLGVLLQKPGASPYFRGTELTWVVGVRNMHDWTNACSVYFRSLLIVYWPCLWS